MSSIVDKKYAEKYKSKEKDWLSKFIDSQVITEDSKKINTEKLLDLARANGIDVKDWEGQEGGSVPGRMRMTLGNMLRAAARKRHGLNDVESKWHDADAEFIGDVKKVQNPDGTKIAA